MILVWRFVIVALKQSLISRVCGRVRPGVQVAFRESVVGFGFHVLKARSEKKSGDGGDRIWRVWF